MKKNRFGRSARVKFTDQTTAFLALKNIYLPTELPTRLKIKKTKKDYYCAKLKKNFTCAKIKIHPVSTAPKINPNDCTPTVQALFQEHRHDKLDCPSNQRICNPSRILDFTPSFSSSRKKNSSHHLSSFRCPNLPKFF